MTEQEREARWLEGRTRHVRVYLTEEEHALVRAAAARADRSVSRFSVEAIVEAARLLASGDESTRRQPAAPGTPPGDELQGQAAEPKGPLKGLGRGKGGGGALGGGLPAEKPRRKGGKKGGG